MLTGNQRVAEPLCQRVGSSKEGHTRKSALISGPPAAIGVFAFLRAGTVEANGGEVAADRGSNRQAYSRQAGVACLRGTAETSWLWQVGAKRNESQRHPVAGVRPYPWQTWAWRGNLPYHPPAILWRNVDERGADTERAAAA